MEDGYSEIKFHFNKSITYSKLPDLEFYLTSEKNSLGAVYFDWMEGEELLVKIPNHQTNLYRLKSMDHICSLNLS